MSLFSKKMSAFAIDFSEVSLKMAKLERKEDFLGLTSFSEAKIPSGVIVESEVRDVKALAKIIKQAMASSVGRKIKDKYAVISLPEEKSFLDVFQLPHLRGVELEDAVRYEAENHIPMGVDDVYFDFEIINDTNNNEKDKLQEVMVAAAPRNIVDSYLASLHYAGLKALAAEVECLSVVRSIIKKEDIDQSFLIIDIGESRTTFIIFASKSPRFTSTIPISSAMITNNIAEKLNVGARKAEELKIHDGLLGDKNVADAAVLSLNDLVSQINNHLKYYYSHNLKEQQVKKPSVKIDKIILCGGGSNLKGLTDFLSASLNMPAEIANPWANIMGDEITEVPGLPFEKSLSFSTALGLALRATGEI